MRAWAVLAAVAAAGLAEAPAQQPEQSTQAAERPASNSQPAKPLTVAVVGPISIAEREKSLAAQYREEREDQRAAEELRIQGRVFVATAAQAAISVLGFIGLVFTVLYARRAWIAAAKSATAADDTYRALLHGERRQLRAYLYVMSNKTPNIAVDEAMEGRFLLKNAGQTPALKVRTVNAMTIGRVPFDGDPPPLPEEMFHGGGVLAPGAIIRLVCNIREPITPPWRQALLNRTHAICMYGEIRYEDIFGEEHVTTYRAMYPGTIEGLDEIEWCRTGNEAT